MQISISKTHAGPQTEMSSKKRKRFLATTKHLFSLSLQEIQVYQPSHLAKQCCYVYICFENVKLFSSLRWGRTLTIMERHYKTTTDRLKQSMGELYIITPRRMPVTVLVNEYFFASYQWNFSVNTKILISVITYQIIFQQNQAQANL